MDPRLMGYPVTATETLPNGWTILTFTTKAGASYGLYHNDVIEMVSRSAADVRTVYAKAQDGVSVHEANMALFRGR